LNSSESKQGIDERFKELATVDPNLQSIEKAIKLAVEPTVMVDPAARESHSVDFAHQLSICRNKTR